MERPINFGRLHGLRGGNVFHRSRGLSKLDMYYLSVQLHLACGELNFDELHLQCGLLGARWRGVHSVCGRKVQA